MLRTVRTRIFTPTTFVVFVKKVFAPRYDPEFDALDLTFLTQVSQFGRCEYLTNSSVECFAVGGSYNGLSFENVINPKCIVPNVTSSVDCYVPEFCSSVSVDLLFMLYSLALIFFLRIF